MFNCWLNVFFSRTDRQNKLHEIHCSYCGLTVAIFPINNWQLSNNVESKRMSYSHQVWPRKASVGLSVQFFYICYVSHIQFHAFGWWSPYVKMLWRRWRWSSCKLNFAVRLKFSNTGKRIVLSHVQFDSYSFVAALLLAVTSHCKSHLFILYWTVKQSSDKQNRNYIL